LALTSKIEESGCDIICLQETKRENFDMDYLKQFCLKRFNKFEFLLPSIGASGGLLIVWNGSLFTRVLSFQNDFSLSVTFTSKITNETWILTNVYGPCLP
jgi:hypothetical protein